MTGLSVMAVPSSVTRAGAWAIGLTASSSAGLA